MKGSLAFLGLAATALAAPKGTAVTAAIKPDGAAPEGCSASFDGEFQVTVFKVAQAKRDLQKRECSGDNTLLLTLKDSVLKDKQARTGYIADNYQFQFDGPPQAGALYTAGFSKCSNGSLALGSSTVFYRCLSGDFYNLYDRHWAPQCEPIEIVAMPCGDAPAGGDAQKPTGKVVGTSQMATTVVTVLADGQPQVVPTIVAVPLCQIGDGQVQGKTTPCDKLPVVTQIGDGQIQAPTGAPVTQISDGQIQAPTTVPVVTEIPDGQVQAPTGAPVTQIGDGQVQAPTGAPVTQISDGQVQAPTGAPVTQISDGQVQAPTGAPVTQISDGQIQAPTSAAVVPTSAPSVVPVAGGAGNVLPGSIAALVAVLGAVLYL